MAQARVLPAVGRWMLPLTRPVRYTSLAISLHWTIAVLLLVQLTLGWWMVDIPKHPPGVRAGWFNLHKSLGLVLFALIAARLAWRLTHRAPELPSWIPAWQRGAAAASHGLMYLLMVIAPLSGYLGSSFTRYPIVFFGTKLPHWGWEWVAAKEVLSRIHFASTLLLALLVAVHVVAALTHLVKRDGVFQRMWPTELR